MMDSTLFIQVLQVVAFGLGLVAGSLLGDF